MGVPKVSVITSVYKSDSFLRTFLECCLEQTYFEYSQYILNISEATHGEKRVLNDMSKFFRGRLRVIHNEKRVGIYQAWNQGLYKSNGELISIWNVDDLRTNESIETQVELMKKNKFLSAAGAFTIVSNYGDYAGVEIKVNPYTPAEFYRSMLHGPFFMFRREVLRKLKGFDEQLDSASDFDFCIRLANMGPVAITNENLGYYLNAGTGMSTSKRIEIATETQFIYQRFGVLSKLDPSFLHLTRKWDLNRIRVLGRNFELENVTQSLDEILKVNDQETDFRSWTIRLKKELRRRRLVTTLFYVKNPLNLYKEVKRKIESATRIVR